MGAKLYNLLPIRDISESADDFENKLNSFVHYIQYKHYRLLMTIRIYVFILFLLFCLRTHVTSSFLLNCYGHPLKYL